MLELDVAAEHAFTRADLVIGSRLRAVPERAADGEDARLALEVSESVQLGSGQQTLALRNELDHEVTLRIERTTSQSDALTAARAWSIPKFRELFPSEKLESGRLVAVGQVSFLILRVLDHLTLIEKKGDAAALANTVRAFDRLQVCAERHQGRLATSGLDLAIAAFERPEDASRAALALFEELCDAPAAGERRGARRRSDPDHPGPGRHDPSAAGTPAQPRRVVRPSRTSLERGARARRSRLHPRLR